MRYHCGGLQGRHGAKRIRASCGVMCQISRMFVAAAFKAAMGAADRCKVCLGKHIAFHCSGGNLPPWARRIRGKIALYGALFRIRNVYGGRLPPLRRYNNAIPLQRRPSRPPWARRIRVCLFFRSSNGFACFTNNIFPYALTNRGVLDYNWSVEYNSGGIGLWRKRVTKTR